MRGALIGALVGDALGSPFAGQTGPIAEGEIGSLESVTARRAFAHDTAMTVGVAESLLFNGGVDQDHLARTLVVRHERRPDRGHGRVTASLLRRIGSGEDWRHAATSQLGGRGSAGSSAAARVTSLGLWASDVHEAARLGHASAQVTHAHPVAVDAAGVQAAAMTGALAGARLGEAAVPTHWRAYTEGVDEVQQLADRIVTRMLNPTAPSRDERFRPPR